MGKKNINAAIILARGGSKGIPLKNIADFCGHPLLAWTIDNCKKSSLIDEVWVSSDDERILEVADSYQSLTIKRPKELSTDTSSSEKAWKHAIKHIESKNNEISIVIAPQVTSPLREPSDFDEAIREFKKNNFDSLFSACIAEDLFFWKESHDGSIESQNFDFRNRPRRQDVDTSYIENGSFYLFTPETINTHNNRFGHKIGQYVMESWKMCEIDNPDDLRICSALMKEFQLDNLNMK